MGIILMILFWVAVVLVLVAAIRWLMEGHREVSGSSGDGGHRTPLEILEERFARGEIEREEFEERRRLLSRRD